MQLSTSKPAATTESLLPPVAAALEFDVSKHIALAPSFREAEVDSCISAS